jgi:hypothetical protein
MGNDCLFVECCRGDDDEKEYLVKWEELSYDECYWEFSYDECYWEFESDISAFQPEIERFNKIQSRRNQLLSLGNSNTTFPEKHELINLIISSCSLCPHPNFLLTHPTHTKKGGK